MLAAAALPFSASRVGFGVMSSPREEAAVVFTISLSNRALALTLVVVPPRGPVSRGAGVIKHNHLRPVAISSMVAFFTVAVVGRQVAVLALHPCRLVPLAVAVMRFLLTFLVVANTFLEVEAATLVGGAALLLAVLGLPTQQLCSMHRVTKPPPIAGGCRRERHHPTGTVASLMEMVATGAL